MVDFSKEIEAYALKNAIEFGQADAGRILPKLFGHGLEKKDIKNIMPQIQEIVKKVNSLSPEEKQKAYSEFSGVVKTVEHKEGGLSELPNPGKKMVFRLAPYPSGDLHIGNAKAYLLNALYGEKYNAKILMVFDDTIGSAEKQIAPEAYNLIKDSFKWLGVKYYKKTYYKSDRIKIYYRYAKQLINKGKAYVCYCSQEQIHKDRIEGKECACRQWPVRAQLARWREMFKMKEGGAVLRLKTDMLDPNPAFRDRVLFKISDRKHPRVKNKYGVWPSLEMNWAIDDHLLGITHIIRGNDLMMETQMEKYIWDIFKWKHPETIHSGMVRIEGMEAKISKSKAQKEVRSGEFIGWDDPRTWSIHSLKRRGFRAEAIREFIKSMGSGNHDVVIPIDSLYSINRKMIDPESNRHSFLFEPIELQVEGNPNIKHIEVPVHPDKDEKRKVMIDKIFIAGEDFKNFRGKEIRLVHLFNMKIAEKGETAKFVSFDNKDIPKINWVSHYVPTMILMPTGIWLEGIADSGVKNLKKGQVIQFERFGFARFDGINKGAYEFWFAHK